MPLPLRCAFLYVAALSLGPLTPAPGAGPADPLLRLVPPDAGVTLAVEDLRGQAKAISGSPIAQGLRKLPAVKKWLETEHFVGIQQAVVKAEKALGVPLATVRDELLGEAVVLTLRVPPGGRPDEARGLLLLRVADGALLERLIERLNSSMIRDRELERVSRREVNGRAYFVREFRAAGRGNEFYSTLDAGVFAWSNDEGLLQGVIDRQATGQGGLAGVPEFQKVRDRLPARALASLFVDPRFLEKFVAGAPRSEKPGEEKIVAALERYLGALRYVGAAVSWGDGVVLHTEEVVDPARVPASLRRWAGRDETPDPTLLRVPASALLVASLDIDFRAVLDALTCLVPDNDVTKLDNLITVLDGILLGLDLRDEVLPHLGPGLTAYVERPDVEPWTGRMPFALSVQLGGGKVSEALDNALRTLLAVYSLDEKNGGGRLRLESRSVGGGKVTTLAPTSPLAYAVREGRLVLARSEAAVVRALAAQADPSAGTRFARIREAFFPESVTFAAADLRAVREFAAPRRQALARGMAARQNRPEADTARDLDQVLDLIELFDAAFLTSRVDKDFSRVRHSLGLVTFPGAGPGPDQSPR